MTNDKQCEKPKKAKEKLSQVTTPEQAEKVKQYFIERISNSKRWKALFRDRLLPNEDYFDSEVWEKIMKDHPERASPFLTFVAFVDVYETLGLFADSIIEVERNIEVVQRNIEIVAKKSNVNLTNLEKDVGELKCVILPKLKGIAELIDRKKLEEERRQRNGDEMIV